MAHRTASRYASYVNILDEVKEIDKDGGVNIDAGPKMSPEVVRGIKLKLLPQQRVILYLLNSLETTGTLQTVLPRVEPPSAGIQKLTGTGSRKVGYFRSNAWHVSLPVGSGKSLILLSLAAANRVPLNRTIVAGVDVSHALLGASPINLREFPRRSPAELARICDVPWYFVEKTPDFPSISPKVLVTRRVEEEDIFPFTLFFCAPQLVQQMEGYCQEQVEYRWLSLRDHSDVASFIVDLIADPARFQDVHVVIVASATLARRDTIYIEGKVEKKKKELKALDGDHSRTLARLDKVIKTLLTRQEEIATSDYFTTLAGCYPRQKYFARVAFDDYDSLPLRGSQRVPSLSTIYISGTVMDHPGNKFGYSCKPTYMDYARRAMTLAVDPAKVVRLMGLLPPRTHNLLCTESHIRESFMSLVEILAYLVRSYKNLYEPRFATRKGSDIVDEYRFGAVKAFAALPESFRKCDDPLGEIVEEIRRAMNCDSVRAAFINLQYLHFVGKEVGLPILPIDMITGNLPSSVSFSTLAAALYRKVHSELMHINVMLLSIQGLSSIMRDRQLSPEIRFVIAAVKNYCKVFSYPPCKGSFKEVAAVSTSTKYAFSALATAPFPGDDDVAEVWKFVGAAGVDVPDPAEKTKACSSHLARYLELFAPYLLTAAWSSHNFGNITVSDRALMDALDTSREALEGILGSVEKLVAAKIHQPARKAKCCVCSKEVSSPTILACCSSIICFGCLPASLSMTQSVLTCRMCGADATRSRLLALPMFSEPAPTMRQLQSDFISIAAAQGACKTERNASTILATYAKLRLFYFPFTKSNVSNLLEPRSVSTAALNSSTAILLDKPHTIKHLFERFIESSRGKPVKVLLYNRYSDSLDELSKLLSTSGVEVRNFTTSDGKIYRESTKHLLIVASDIAQLYGFNMEYLKAVVAYSPINDAERRSQFVGRGQRLTRDKNEPLYDISLFYRNEVTDGSVRANLVAGSPIWTELAPPPEPRVIERGPPAVKPPETPEAKAPETPEAKTPETPETKAPEAKTPEAPEAKTPEAPETEKTPETKAPEAPEAPEAEDIDAPLEVVPAKKTKGRRKSPKTLVY